jgi:uncharacterized membrane protein YsdA (DUF1294 family)/cold shock CspA family protein
MRYQGRITRWKDEQGYGFILPDNGGGEVFVHIKAFNPRQARPAGDEPVTYELVRDANGRARAAAVAFVSSTARRPVGSNAGPSNYPLLPVLLFFAFVGVLAVAGKLPLMLFGYYVFLSLITFAVYALDKSAAQDGRRRTPENNLHLLAVVGGWPGALAAQNRLRHKSSKTSFLVVFWIAVLLNCSALGIYMSPTATKALREAIGVAACIVSGGSCRNESAPARPRLRP